MTMQSATSDPAATVRPGRLYKNAAPGVVIRQRFLHQEAGLDFLDCAEIHVPAGARSMALQLEGRESLLFMWKGAAEVEIRGARYELAPYDTIYVPLGHAWSVSNPHGEDAVVFLLSAPAVNVHPVFHSSFAEFSRREDRIRHLKGKDVYMMFDVGEGADKLVAGYTFFQPGQRSWPPHNHTDQEETYIFIRGRGSMEVYESPETLSFVHSVDEGDLVTIPILNYHPVFSQESPLEFIWCIAGERYWVGDKNKDFMKGGSGPLTT